MGLLLIDSLYINNSGGLRLLEYLVAELQKREVNFFLLADSRCQGKFNTVTNVHYMKASLKERNAFYKTNCSRFTSVLCFGNIPAPIKLEVPIYTYFHNINLLTLAETHSIKVKVVSWLKREVFKHYKKNTNYWLVQTSNTATELINHLGETPNRVKLMPFYELPVGVSEIAKLPHGDDYVYISDYYPEAKGHEELIESWKSLHKIGIDKTLHLTIHERNRGIIDVINAARDMGVRVINHGFIPFEDVFDLYKKSKALIYPSHNESLGLGIVEAITAGCDVIGADLPYVYAICNPSGVFSPNSPDAIVKAVTEYEKNKPKKSSLTIYNHIEELVDLLTENQLDS